MIKKILSILFSIIQIYVIAQNNVQQVLNNRNEAIVSFSTKYLTKIPDFKKLSIDKIKNDTITVYITQKQYNKLVELNIPLKQEQIPSLVSNFKMFNINLKSTNEWNSYPDYSSYISLMNKFSTDFPEICKLDTIGYSVNNRLLLALKISDNVAIQEDEPAFFYTSSMHGDELTGYVLLLHLADYLLTNYDNTKIKNLINNVEIYINPLANPDGTFKTGDETVSGATRFNANGIDLNRNFPDIEDGNHPDDNEWQPETVAMMDFMKKHNFNLSMNFHGGEEVLNYPWDTFKKRHADDKWFQYICRQYVDTAHKVDANYMTVFDNGITNGYDWYSISGGRQDYVTYFLHGREVTTELSKVKLIDAEELPAFWNKNYKSLINYIDQTTYGIHGIVTNSKGSPITANIKINNYDTDSSSIFSNKKGLFYRYLQAGVYSITISAVGYISKTVDIVLENNKKTDISIQLEKSTGINDTYNTNILYPNPVNNKIYFNNNYFCNNNIEYTISNINGVIVKRYLGKKSSFNINLPAGVYIFTAKNNKKIFTKKIIIQ